jgi:hypothetical protein
MAQSRFLGCNAAILAVILVLAPASGAQRVGRTAGNVSISAATAGVLQRMTRSAGVIFAGQVVAVRGPAGDEGVGAGIVTVEFRVDKAVRGCANGSIYTLKEWAGLWNGHGGRYQVGQWLLMFLYRPSRGGLSSPVHGAEGAVPLRGGGLAPGPYDAASEASEWMVDLRWVQAQAVRGPEVAGPRVVGPGFLPEPDRDATQELERDSALGSAEPYLVPVAGGGRQHWTRISSETGATLPPLSQVLRLCRSWIGPPDGAR